MSIVLQSTSGGSVTINEPTTASNFTQTLPAGTGTVVVSGINSAITAGTAVASTSGTSIDFTSIPSWVKRVTVMVAGLSTNGSSVIQIQLGDSGGVETSGYTGTTGYNASFINYSAGITLDTASSVAAGTIRTGAVVFNLLGSNQWVCFGTLGLENAAGSLYIGGRKTLSGTLDRVRITTVNGTDTFDAGSINILYE